MKYHHQETTFQNEGIFKSKQFRQRKKTIEYGQKDRSSAIYKYLKEKQKALLDYRPRSQVSQFSAEEDRVLILLVKKLGPKFHKITRYFSGKTVNMIKNRYYKTLRHVESQEFPKELEEELFSKNNESRVIGSKILNLWPQHKQMSSVIEGSPLFPEAKEILHTFLSSFQELVSTCKK
ncbi:unnamed protein product (macronuclear) [Paramecium tetraurelia]|uniref:Uncharacterized protein n=1 Tax=Paramecium tetraurelia TaxID=5888 RepID=A0CV94_PARTE|nr:uncharacterized protein GSPATT00010879001 [Paramecium tetraurelia]CAK74711.1 unnamed protein product [Paramecium tetraurelia]|eukprot:XP_001442108.1 hypothetical protein (macronuclear) [Paramecium tetraurelia strain d4-2]